MLNEKPVEQRNDECRWDGSRWHWRLLSPEAVSSLGSGKAPSPHSPNLLSFRCEWSSRGETTVPGDHTGCTSDVGSNPSPASSSPGLAQAATASLQTCTALAYFSFLRTPWCPVWQYSHYCASVATTHCLNVCIVQTETLSPLNSQFPLHPHSQPHRPASVSAR